MPNTFGGRNFKKVGKKRKSKNPNIAVPTDTGIDYHGQVIKRIGGNQLQVKVFALNEDIIANIPGRFMRKVWFNSGDYIHVQQQGKFFDVIQKLQLDDEISNAKRIQNKNAMTGEEDIFRQDEEEKEGDFDEIPDSGSESDEDELGNKDSVDKISTKNISKSEKISSVKINKNNVSTDKLRRKLQGKERDLSRRADNDFAEKPTSIVEKDDESVSDDDPKSDDPKSDDPKSNDPKSNDPKSDDINIDDI